MSSLTITARTKSKCLAILHQGANNKYILTRVKKLKFLDCLLYNIYSLEGVESRPDRIVGGEDRFLDCLLYNIYSLEGVESRPDRIVGGEDRFLDCLLYNIYSLEGVESRPDRIVGGEEAEPNEFPWQVITPSFLAHHHVLRVSFTGHWNLNPRISCKGLFLPHVR